jgi:hypothetical protein
MSLLLEIVAEEKSRIENMIPSYEREWTERPKGSLVCKKVKNLRAEYAQAVKMMGE